ncbi:MAG: hypothetical protein HFI73_05860, partial [Bacilli bacterium]|nr:hypothetical protein [Bacilli bacterium]
MKDFKLPKVEDEQSVLKTIRIKYSVLKRIEELSKVSNISVNKIINECIDFALENLDES